MVMFAHESGRSSRLKGIEPVRLASIVLLTTLAGAGCCKVPESVRVFAGDLPARADGQYALVDDLVKKQLVMKDSELQCKIDVEDGKTEEASPACLCTKSSSADWIADCKTWLGAHTPAPAAPAPVPAPPAPVPPAPAPPP